ncbi:MAG TPA: hypothetical protein VIL99_01085 [Ignavibacteria bacterium]
MNNNSKISDSEDRFEFSDFPVNSEIAGIIPADGDLRIFIRKSTIEDIDAYLSTDKSNECGGVLIGNVFKDDFGQLFIISDNFIIAEKTISGISKLTFTHDTWQEINDELDKYYNNKVILGWFHSHPGHRVFLSGYDIFIQENFFRDRFMVAYVFDPVNNEKAFFNWKEDKIIKSEGYYIINDNIKTSIELNNSITKEKITSKKNIFTVSKNKFYFLALALIINVIITVLLILDNNVLKSRIEDLDENNSQWKVLKNSIEKIELKVNDLMINQLNKQDSIKINNGIE